MRYAVQQRVIDRVALRLYEILHAARPSRRCFGLTSVGFAIALAENPASAPRTITVALDGSGISLRFKRRSIVPEGRYGVDQAGTYAQDLTIHSKEKIKIVGAESTQRSWDEVRWSVCCSGEVAVWGNGH